jgi:PAS domain S-box-containing protein
MMFERKRSILIVEDEQIVAMDLQQTLTELGYDVLALASSAEEAIARAAERCPDVALLDIRIKGRRDGIETAAILKRQFGVPVIYLSAHADDTTLDRAKATEPYGYLMKPMKAAELRSAIEICLYRSEMESALRARERGFATALQSVTDAIVTVDIGGKITFMNAAAESLTGVRADEAVGRFARDILWSLEHAEGEQREAPVSVALREGRTVGRPEPRLRPTALGVERWIDDSAVPVVEGDETLGGVMVFRDVSEQRHLQKQLEFADRLSSLGTMAAGVAHEINNPLAVVMGTAGYLKEELEACRSALARGGPPPNAKQLEAMLQAVVDVQSAADRIGNIISDLRAFSRPAAQSAGAIDVVECAKWATRATAKEFHRRARVVTRFEAVEAVRADETRLGQVLVNLLVNAAHAIAPGDPEKNQVTLTTRTASSGRVEIEVRDTGAGIPQEVLGRIFEPFFTTKTADVGTGLGLSICHGIVTSLGGELRVETEIGKGTAFVVALPPAREEALPETTARHGDFTKGRLLLIDDEQLGQRATARILRGHDVVCVASTARALALFEHGETFDLVLCDLTAPSMAHAEFYEAMLARDPDLAARIVFFTDGAPSTKAAACLAATANLRIRKPFDVPTLQDAIQRALVAQRDRRRG